MAAKKTAAEKDERSREHRAADNDASGSQFMQVFQNLIDNATGAQCV